MLAGGGGAAAAEQWEPVLSPLLLQACWQQLEACWTSSGAISTAALRSYVGSGALAAAAAEEDEEVGGTEGGGGQEAADPGFCAGMLGAYLQLQGVPGATALQQTSGQVQEMLLGAQLPSAAAAAAAAAAMLATTHRGLSLPAAQAIATALLH